MRRFVESSHQLHRSTGELGEVFKSPPFTHPPEISAFTDEAMAQMGNYHDNIAHMSEADDLKGHCERDVVSKIEVYINHLEHVLKLKTKVKMFSFCLICID